MSFWVWLKKAFSFVFNSNFDFDFQGNPSGFFGTLKYLFRSELRHRILQLAQLSLLPRSLSAPLLAAFAQAFEGDVTVVPRLRWSDMRLLLANPTPAILRRLARHGYRSSFPFAEAIRNRTAIEFALEKAILTLAEPIAPNPTARARARHSHSTSHLAYVSK